MSLPLILLSVHAWASGDVPSADARHQDVFSHEQWGKVLHAYVDERGDVDYHRLATDRAGLDQYLSQVSVAGPDITPERFPTTDHQLAYYINAYNALVFEGVLDWGPDIDSVWRGLISGFRFFSLRKVSVDGRTMTLKSLEDDVIRARFRDPRIHAAINCASISCPRLRREPYGGDQLQVQLNAAMAEFVNSPDHVRRQGSTLLVSQIFKWFESDFEDMPGGFGPDGKLVDYINRYRREPLPRALRVEYLDYDKGLNRQKR
ncbi:MAG: DUF547 domain-containing protein [Proteobacteria bacterium]|nr:DUF547 domain-containing protein [Pseudomonadota bacterium]